MAGRWSVALVGLALFGLAGNAQASLIGTTVDYDRVFNGFDLGPGPAVVGPGIEFSDVGGGFLSDIDASSIAISGSGGFGFTTAGADGIQQFIRYSGLTWVNDPGAVIDSIDVTFGDILGDGTGGIPFSTANVSFSVNTITLLVGGYNFPQTGFFINIAITPDHAVIPEPSTLAIFAFGLAGLGFVTRRRRTGVGKTRNAS